MNKSEQARAIQKARGCSFIEAMGILNMVIDVLKEHLENDESINLQGFGVLKPWHQTSRLARNPRTGETVSLQSRISVKFRPGKFLLEGLNRKKK